MNVLAVLIVASAAACINVGKALQKQGTRGLPRLVLDRKVLGTYLQDRTWATGLALDVLGGVLMVAAIARAPVSLVQPVAAGGVAVLAVFSHLVMEEKLRASEWAGVAAAMVGTVGIGVSTEEQQPAALSTWRYAAGVGLVLAMLALPTYLSTSQRAPRRGAGAGGGLLGGGGKKIVGVLGGVGTPKGAVGGVGTGSGGGERGGLGGSTGRVDEVVAGMHAGTCFSLSALACKIGFILGSRYNRMFVLLGIAASIGLTGSGLVCQTRGLKDGNSVVVVTCGNVAQMVTAVVFGVAVLGESLPSNSKALRTWIASWSLILAGVVAISGVTVDEVKSVGAAVGAAGQGLGGLSGLSGLRGRVRHPRMILPVLAPKAKAAATKQ